MLERELGPAAAGVTVLTGRRDQPQPQDEFRRARLRRAPVRQGDLGARHRPRRRGGGHARRARARASDPRWCCTCPRSSAWSRASSPGARPRWVSWRGVAGGLEWAARGLRAFHGGASLPARFDAFALGRGLLRPGPRAGCGRPATPTPRRPPLAQRDPGGVARRRARAGALPQRPAELELPPR